MRARRALLTTTLLALPAGALAAQRARPTRPAAAPPAAAAPKPAPESLVDVTGTVFDSVAGAPLAGAAVQLVPVADQRKFFAATADSAGVFHLARVPAGRYYGTFVHPSLDVLGIEPPVSEVAVAPRTPVALAIAGPRRLFDALCAGSPPYDSLGALVGRVFDADGDAGIGGAKLVLTWQQAGFSATGARPGLHRVPVLAKPDGSFLVCNVPSNVDVEVSAEAPGRRGGVVDGGVPYRALRRLDLALGDPASALATVRTVTDSAGRPRDAETLLRGTARLSGTVVAGGGEPLAGARVLVIGTAASATTQADGTFALSGLPAGTYSLEARAIGFEPHAVPVTLASGRTAAARVLMDRRVQTLAAVKVVGRKSFHSRDYDDFLERRAHGTGHYYTAEDIARTRPLEMSSLLRTAPGLHVVPSGGSTYAIRGRGNCRPSVFVDGLPVSDGDTDIDQFVRPDDVAGMEVYNDAMGVPMQYAAEGCGSVLIWTKR